MGRAEDGLGFGELGVGLEVDGTIGDGSVWLLLVPVGDGSVWVLLVTLGTHLLELFLVHRP